MKKFYTIIAIICFSIPRVVAQELHVEWTRFIGGSSYETAYDAIETIDGGVVFTGFTNSHNDGDIPANPVDTGTTGLASNLIIGKIDSNRQLNWIKVYGGTHQDYGQKVTATEDGYIILGYTQSTDGNVTNYHGDGDVWLIKTDKQGNLMWEKAYGGPNSQELPLSIATTEDKGYIVLAASNGSGGDVPMHYGGQFSFDWFVFKTDSAGTIQWTKTLGGSDDESSDFGCILEADNGYFLASSSSSRDHDCTDLSWHSTATTTLKDCYILRLDAAGDVIWNRSYGGSSGDLAYDAKWEASDSSLIVAASTHSNDYMVQNNHGSNDIWVFKTDNNGNYKWGHTYGGTLDDDPCNIIQDPDGGFMVAGKASSTVPIPTGYFSVYSNMLLLKLDSSGNAITQKIVGGEGPDWPASVVHYQHGYGAVGFTQSPFFAEGSNTANHGPSTDLYVSVIDYFPLSVSQPGLDKTQLKVYPNPSHGSVNVQLPTNEKGGNLTIVNNSGAQVYAQKIKPGLDSIAITTKDWAKGFYMVQWESVTKERLTVKLIIN